MRQERRERRTESVRRKRCVQVCQKIWATVDTTHMENSGMKAVRLVEVHRPLQMNNSVYTDQ